MFALNESTIALSVALLIQIGIVIFSIQVIVTAGNGKPSQSTTNNMMEILQQLPSDWQTQPFVQISVVKRGNDCPADTEPVFSLDFLGTAMGCVDSEGEVKVDTKEDPCPKGARAVNPVDPYSEIYFNNSAYCGKRGGLSFLDVTRPDPESGVCPEGTKPCSEKTSAENTFCLDPSLIPQQCPITKISFINKGQSPAAGQVALDSFDSANKVFVYSKDTDNLPITSTLVEFKPCLVPTKQSIDPADKFYPTQFESQIACVVDEFIGNGSEFDPRFKSAGKKISLGSIMQESNLQYQILLPNYIDYVPTGTKDKVMVEFWTRPALPWKLECETQNPRAEVAEALTSTKFDQSTYYRQSVTQGYVMLGVTLVFGAFAFGLAGFVVLKENYALLTLPLVGMLLLIFVQINVVIWMFGTHVGAKALSLNQLNALETYSVINGCSDDLTEVPDEALAEDQDYTVRDSVSRIYASSMTIVVLVSLFLILGFAASVARCIMDGKLKDQ